MQIAKVWSYKIKNKSHVNADFIFKHVYKKHLDKRKKIKNIYFFYSYRKD
jgi:hypothetical protein